MKTSPITIKVLFLYKDDEQSSKSSTELEEDN